MAWAQFDDEAAFRAYHDAVCSELGIPFPGRNAATDEVELDAQWTTAATDPWVDVDGVLKANVRTDDLDTYGLKPTSEPTWTDPAGLTQGAEPPPWDWHQPIPDRKAAT